MAARDAKIGAVGAQQVRDLYKENKSQEAKDLANDYLKANVAGIALGAGAGLTSSGIKRVVGEGLIDSGKDFINRAVDNNFKGVGVDLLANTTLPFDKYLLSLDPRFKKASNTLSTLGSLYNSVTSIK
jgi:hypothetical protein